MERKNYLLCPRGSRLGAVGPEGREANVGVHEGGIRGELNWGRRGGGSGGGSGGGPLLGDGLGGGPGESCAWERFALGRVVATGGSGPLGPILGLTREQLFQDSELT